MSIDPDETVRRRLTRRFWLQDVARRAADGRLGLAVPRSTQSAPAVIRKILICNAGHYGDVILSTSAIARIRDAYPHAEIGFLGGSIALTVLAQYPEVSRVHVLEHWYHQ